MNEEIIIIASKNHPFYERLIGEKFKIFDIDEDDFYTSSEERLGKAEAIFDFTILSRIGKKDLIDLITTIFKGPIFSDLTCYAGESFMNEFSSLSGCFSSAFYQKGEKIEIYGNEDTTTALMINLFAKMKVNIIQVSSPGIGFIYPRVIGQIINEAYFSLEDELACAEDIDRAMKFGVNYPEGPLALAEKIGQEKICLLLDELFFNLKDPRYRASQLLRNKAMSINAQLFE